jgi:hypothetical protein
MPEATVHKDHGSLRTKDQIWRTGQVGDVEPVAKSALMQESTNPQFWSRVLALDRRHVPAALVRADRIQCFVLRCGRFEIIFKPPSLKSFIERTLSATGRIKILGKKSGFRARPPSPFLGKHSNS